MSGTLANSPVNGTLLKPTPASPPPSPVKSVADLSTAALNGITKGDVAAVVDNLLRRAKAGDRKAAKEVLDRALGKPKQGMSLEAIFANQQDYEEQLDEWGQMRRMFLVYAKLMVPKRAWMPGLLAQYRAWLEANVNGHRPADWDQIVTRVEVRCNWIWVTPDAAKDWRIDCMIFDGQNVKLDERPYQGPLRHLDEDKDLL
jgi:hypothetical protein